MKIKKTSGEYPLTITTSAGSVEFDEKGIAEVDEEAAELLLSIPGYEAVKDNTKKPETPKATDDDSKPKSDSVDAKKVDADSDQKKEAATASKPADATTKKTAESK
ncbi:DUF7349 domain-containing protein [Paenibacillus hunanensis]|uniref:DUF7349 domain-containing protein n=1 Tax=Paenibacillus hunanensis TaxID=539262 RepID=A0ABU1IVG1_9BACL|nr:hypothetical protein [Paenibacillus hunanensis]MDR6243154.1 hypothetical protein [Paenibacillus hunanensis]GGJ11398.1 hypothetical protein GCM10008022_20710 [Paenibacillus hunanensis]